MVLPGKPTSGPSSILYNKHPGGPASVLQTYTGVNKRHVPDGLHTQSLHRVLCQLLLKQDIQYSEILFIIQRTYKFGMQTAV